MHSFLNSSKIALANRLRPILVYAGYHSKPRFLIIGAQKAGTTALYYYLAEHPNIVPSSEKEIGFFTPEAFEDWKEHPNHPILCAHGAKDFFDPKIYRRTAAWYHNHFPLPHELGRNRMTFEATPEYLYYPRTAERIFKYDPKIKLIVLLRDPVERAFSAWNMYRNFDESGYRPLVYAPRREVRKYDQAIRDELHEIQFGKQTLNPGYVCRGLYYEQLIRYFKFFDRTQILILDSRTLKNDTSGAVNQVVDFLGLPKFKLNEWSPLHEGRYETQMPMTTRCLLSEFYKPYNEKLYQLLEHNFGWQ